jgi:hypothetical protein
MSRADVPASERSPFYLYVDEFQNFATDSFATILSEARKYGLNLTVANQYIDQMPMEVRDAVFGNVGSIIAFRMSADDANKMLRYFQPKFEEADMVHMHNRYFLISMTIDGEKAQGFSAISLNLPDYTQDYSQVIIDASREKYAIRRDRVESYVNERYHDDKKPAAKPFAKPPLAVTSQQPVAAGSKAPAAAEKPAVAASGKVKNPGELAKTVVKSALEPPAAKPKRKRRRRKKPAASAAKPQPQESKSGPRELNSGHSIRLQ